MELILDLILPHLSCDDICRARLVDYFWKTRVDQDSLWAQLYSRDFKYANACRLFDYATEYRLMQRTIVYSFGSNHQGQTGNLSPTSSRKPTHVSHLKGIQQISAGAFFSAFLDWSGQVWICGDGALGPIGETQIFGLRKIKNIPPVVKIFSGICHLLMIDHQGKVWGIGSNRSRQLGIGEIESINQPQCLNFPQKVKIKDISLYLGETLFLDDEQRVWVCGNNEQQQFGLEAPMISTPVRLKYRNVVRLYANSHHSIIVKQKDSDSLALIILESDRVQRFNSKILNYSVGYNHHLEMKRTDSGVVVRAAGNNSHGQCGNNRYGTINVYERKIPELTSIEQISAGYKFSLVINDGTVYSFGSNQRQRAGLSRKIEKKGSPTPIILPKFQGRAIQVSAGRRHGLVLFRRDLAISKNWKNLDQLTAIGDNRYRDANGRTFSIL